jgi:ferredoxin
LGGIVFWFIVSASIVGLPLLLFLDPLSTFTRLGVMGRGTAHAMAWVSGVLIPLLLILSFVQPGIWCAQLCPLGFLLEKVKLKRSAPRQVNLARRELLTGLALGLPFAVLFKRAARATEKERPVLPPGAKDLDNFSATCIRCYACVNACPTGVLTVRDKSGIAELCIPEMDFLRVEGAFCEQYCDACSQVCPSGAIAAMTLEEKQQRKIATASIKREACLAWEDRLDCVACDEYCAYKSIEMRTGRDGIPKPFINPKKCRGCGACQNICPAIRDGNAVVMEPRHCQTIITPEDDASRLPPGNGKGGRRRRGLVNSGSG